MSETLFFSHIESDGSIWYKARDGTPCQITTIDGRIGPVETFEVVEKNDAYVDGGPPTTV